MNSQDLKQCINRLEECADEAKRAAQGGKASGDLLQSIEALHQQARQAKQDAASQGDDGLRQCVLKIESAADRAMQACRSAGQVDPQLQQAVQRAHSEASRAKKEVQADSPA